MNARNHPFTHCHSPTPIPPRAAALILISFAVLSGCSDSMPGGSDSGEAAAMEEGGFERGPNNGRVLRDGEFAVELAVYEAGVPPEFRAWATEGGRALDPRDVELRVVLARLGDRVDRHEFRAADEFLRGTSVVYEPHSFSVSVTASRNGRTHQWEYDSFEGRTRISSEMAAAFGLRTAIAGPATIDETITVYGRIVPDPNRVREIRARFDGAIRAVHAMSGETVAEGQLLATVESNESLQSYTINAPIAGVITARTANAGEHTAGRQLFTIVDTSSVWAQLSIFPGDRAHIGVGTAVTVAPATGGTSIDGTISYIDVFSASDQSVAARVVLDNGGGSFAPGMYVTADARIASHEVPLAVRRNALQTFRDFNVVYARVSDVYEVRMLELGRAAGDWVEVLGGLEPGTVYVTENSYVLKADIEKSGATHDH